jgi:hypothetical protein
MLVFVLPVLLTGDFSVFPVGKRDSPITGFFKALIVAVSGLWFMTMLPKGMATFLFFNNHMEIRPFLFGKKKIYPYEVMKVHIEKVGVSGKQANTIVIKRTLPFLENTWLNEDIVTIPSLRMQEEEFSRMEHFLAERVKSFYRENAAEAGKKKKAMIEKLKWIYAIMLISWLVLMGFCFLYYR